MQRLEDTSTSFNVGMAMLAYSACSSSLLLANKVNYFLLLYLPPLFHICKLLNNSLYLSSLSCIYPSPLWSASCRSSSARSRSS